MKYLLSFLLCIAASGLLKAQDPYVFYWKQVAEYEKKDMPRKQLQALNTVFKIAKNRQNSYHMLCSMRRIFHVEQSIDWKKAPEVYEKFTGYAPYFTDASGKTMYQVLMVQLSNSLHTLEKNRKTIEARIDTLLFLKTDLKKLPVSPYDFFGETDEVFTPGNLYECALMKMHYALSMSGNRAGALPLLREIRDLSVPGSDNHLHALCRIALWENPYDKDKQRESLARIGEDYPQKEGVCEARYHLARLLCQKAARKEESPYILARELCRSSLRRFPNNRWKKEMKELINEIEYACLRLDHPDQIYPGQDLNMVIRHRNLDRVKISLSLIPDFYSRYFVSYLNGNHLKPIKNAAKKIVSFSLSDLTNPLGVVKETPCSLTLSRPGVYLISVTGGACEAYSIVTANEIAVSSRRLSGRQQIYCANFRSGKPYKNGFLAYSQPKNVNNFTRGLRYERPKPISPSGFTFLPAPDDNRARYFQFLIASSPDSKIPVAGKSADAASIPLPLRQYAQPRRPDENKLLLTLFTDRTLYRPTDTLRFKAVCYTCGLTRSHTEAGRKLTVSLSNPSSQKIVEQEYTTNEYGSIEGKVVIPPGNMNGQYLLQVRDKEKEARDNVYLRIETYQRPNFTLKVETPRGDCSYGSEILIKGKIENYAGFGITDARIDYTVTLRPHWRRFFPPVFTPRIIAQGSVLSGERGDFSFPFVARRAEEMDASPFVSDYEVIITAKDPQGETRSTSMVLPAGDIPYYLTCNLQNTPLIIKERSTPANIRVNNLLNREQDLSGSWKLQKTGPDSRTGVVVDQGSFRSGKDLPIDFSGLPSGSYSLSYSLPYGDKSLADSLHFCLCGLADKQMPCDSVELFYNLSDREIDFLMGTSSDRLYVLFEIFDRDSLLHSECIPLSRGLHRIRKDYEASFPDNLNLSLFFIRDGKAVQKTFEVARPEPDRNLELVFHSLRKIYKAGKQENFHVSWKARDPLSRPASDAELLLAVFDTTTERFDKNEYVLNAYRPVTPIPAVNSHSMQALHLSYANRGLYYARQEGLSFAAADAAAGPVVDGRGEKEKLVPTKTYQNVLENVEEERRVEEENPETVPIRSNFDETLGFWPCIEVAAGEKTDIPFRTGDLLSTFKVLAFAHTKDMFSGQAEAVFTVQKEAMMLSSFPAFIREGDILYLQAKVVNLSANKIKGTARILFFADDQPLALLPACKATKLHLEPGGQQSLKWLVNVPANLPLMKVRVIFESGKLSDAEEVILPVLASRKEFTETRVFTMDKSGNYSFPVADLLNRPGARDRRISVQVNTPLLSAFESLPCIAAPAHDNLTDWMAAYYATQTASHLLQTVPALRQHTLRTLASAKADRYHDPLENNETLTGILLSETPWQAQPQKERNRLLKMEQLMDTAYVSRMRRQAVEKFAALQHADGGFSWFEQMPSSIWLTAFYLDKMAQMREMGVLEPDRRETRMAASAIAYTDNYLASLYKKSRKSLPLEILYVRSFYSDIPVDGGAREAFDYFLHRAGNSWTGSSIMDKVMTCRIMENYGYKTTASDILSSLGEYAVINATVGCYFPNAVLHRGLLQSELRAHALLLRLFAGHAQESPTYGRIASGISRWLLLQKENQVWENNTATCDAVYALTLSQKPESIENTDAFRIKTSPDAILNNGKNIKIHKYSDGLMFVSVFYQYTQDMQQVKAAATGLKLSRRFYKSTVRDMQKEWIALEPGECLHTGQEIRVSYFITNDENRNFVHLKALHPACLMPVNEKSAYCRQGSVGAYREVKENATHYFFYTLPEADTRVDEYYFVSQEGRFNAAVAEIQSLYAPQYRGVSHSDRLQVEQ